MSDNGYGLNNEDYDDNDQDYEQDEQEINNNENNNNDQQQQDQQYDDNNENLDDLIKQQQELEEDSDDDDFPEYANEQNKKLNYIIKQKRKLIKEFRSKYNEKKDRMNVLKEHYKNVKNELLHTQQLIDSKNKEIEAEDHLKQMAERQIDRFESDLKKLEKNTIEEQERVNDVQNQVFRGKEKLDRFKLKMNWNQEELEQWALAAKQKEEDNLTLEKYRRTDENKIKEANLTIEKLTIDVAKKENELEEEITKTQTAQIELDKTAEEFKRHHEERHKLFQQWQDVKDNINRRDRAIVEEGENYARIKLEIHNIKQTLEKRKKLLDEEKSGNKQQEDKNKDTEKKINEQRANNKQINLDMDDLNAEVQILKNQLSAFASDLSQKQQRLNNFNQELLNRKQRLNYAQQKFNQQEIKLKIEDGLALEFDQDKSISEALFQEKSKEMKKLLEQIDINKNLQFKSRQELFKAREKEANLYGEIQGIMAGSRNLQSLINKLNIEFQRIQELTYNAEYQIQLMERKVARASGKRTHDEKSDLSEEILNQKNIQAQVLESYKLLDNSIKKIDIDIWRLQQQLSQMDENMLKLKQIKKELRLENDMTIMDLNKVIKQKEEALVRHDIMKLEIKKIADQVNSEIDVVFEMENRKYQLEMSMQEREKEIMVHRDVLLAEHKAAEEERYNIAIQLSERKNKVKNMKIKYESLVQKNKNKNTDNMDLGEHSQAYYVIKAAQEKEELVRKGDELNAKINKCEMELKALKNVSEHLSNRNSNYRDGFLNKGVTEQDYQIKDQLDLQCKNASKNLFEKQKELTKVNKEHDEDMKRFSEIQSRINVLKEQYDGVNINIDKLNKEIQEQRQKHDRAQKSVTYQKNNLKQNNKNIENTVAQVQMSFEQENNKYKTIINAIYQIINEYPELTQPFEDYLKEKNINLPSHAPSQIDVNSTNRSINSQQSSRRN